MIGAAHGADDPQRCRGSLAAEGMKRAGLATFGQVGTIGDNHRSTDA